MQDTDIERLTNKTVAGFTIVNKQAHLTLVNDRRVIDRNMTLSWDAMAPNSTLRKSAKSQAAYAAPQPNSGGCARRRRMPP